MYIGNINISNAYIGETGISRIYLGDDKIYPEDNYLTFTAKKNVQITRCPLQGVNGVPTGWTIQNV